jgi:hypothetical protein
VDQAGLPDAGKILVFNNGLNRPGGNYSSVDIIDPPVDTNGDYAIAPGQPFGPSAATWSYTATPPGDFFSANISGAQALSNGGFMICEGVNGRFFEIDSTDVTRWEYINPIAMSGPMTQGQIPVNNAVFRCTLIDPSYPGLAGQTLVPGAELELDPLVPSICSIALDVPQEAASPAFSIAPNPANDRLLVIVKDGPAVARIELLDAAGRTIRRIALNGSEVAIDLDGIRGGLYLVRAIAADRVSVLPVVVDR